MRVAPVSLVTLGAAACAWLNNVPVGTLEGHVKFANRAAPGKVVTLLLLRGGQFVQATTANGSPRRLPTDASGVYRFTGLAAGIYRISYVSQSVPDGNGIPREPNEVGIWRSHSRELTGSSGAQVPGFDVAYNGLIYPVAGIAYIVTASLPLPFHWSTHLLGNRYRVNVYNNRTGREPAMHHSPWSEQPVALYKENLGPGTYSWEVEIDGGESGEGRSVVRPVDMGPPNKSPDG